MEGRLFKAEWQKEDGLLHSAVIDNTLSIRSWANQSRAIVTTGLESQLAQLRLKGMDKLLKLTGIDFFVGTSEVDT